MAGPLGRGVRVSCYWCYWVGIKWPQKHGKNNHGLLRKSWDIIDIIPYDVDTKLGYSISEFDWGSLDSYSDATGSALLHQKLLRFAVGFMGNICIMYLYNFNRANRVIHNIILQYIYRIINDIIIQLYTNIYNYIYI